MILDASLLELIAGKLRNQNMRLTSPRRRALEIFMSAGRLQTPRDLFLRAKEEGISIGLTTIYRLLGILTEMGLARIYPINGETKYVFCSPRHHHHIICTRCGMFREEFNCLLRPVEMVDFQPESHQLDFFGICRSCLEKEKAAASDSPEVL